MEKQYGSAFGMHNDSLFYLHPKQLNLKTYSTHVASREENSKFYSKANTELYHS